MSAYHAAISEGTAPESRATDTGAAPRPVIFTFHGTGGSEQQFHGLARQILPQARVISPRGDVSEAGQARYFRRTGEGQYDMEDLAARTEAMAGFMDDQSSAHAPRLGLGYSNGANILASVMFLRPELIDAAVLMHPLIPFAPPDQPGLAGRRILITAGRNDPICPERQTDALAYYLDRQGADVDLIWHDGGHEIRESEIDALVQFLAEASHPGR